MTDTLDALERLARLHQSGALTDAEFADQKAKVLRGGGSIEGAGYVADEAPAESGWSGGRLLLAGLGAVLIGVLLWWQLVDIDGQVKQVPTPGTVAASGKSDAARPSPATSPSAASPSEPAERPLAVQSGTASAPVTFKPSFSCEGQDETTLVLICESQDLSRKDRLLSERFKNVLRSLGPDERDDVLRRQREFLRERSACGDTACLDDWYERTIEYYM